MEKTAKHFQKRDAILSCLRSSAVHPSAEWVYTQLKPEFPDLSLGTVYRNLAYFKEQGIIASLGTVRGAERFDGNPRPHVHFICTKCGSILDLKNIAVPERLRSSAAEYVGGEIERCQLTFTGTCGKCRNAKQAL